MDVSLWVPYNASRRLRYCRNVLSAETHDVGSRLELIHGIDASLPLASLLTTSLTADSWRVFEKQFLSILAQTDFTQSLRKRNSSLPVESDGERFELV
jgi:hypothetical protein